MKRIARELYGRSKILVAVRPIRLTSNVVIEPGEEVDEYKVRTFQKQNWYRQRRVGVKGAAWTEAMLKDTRTHARPEVVVSDESTRKGTTNSTQSKPVPDTKTIEETDQPLTPWGN